MCRDFRQLTTGLFHDFSGWADQACPHLSRSPKAGLRVNDKPKNRNSSHREHREHRESKVIKGFRLSPDG
jgi:hypothetical protein